MILQVEFAEENAEFVVEFKGGQTFEVDFGQVQEVVSGNIPVYGGPYTVKPSLEEQTLETVGLLMAENLKIEEIPIYVVSNNSGGNTVIIGG